MFCVYCGQKIKEESSFCPYCGKKLPPKKDVTTPSQSGKDQQDPPAKRRTKQQKSRRGFGLLWFLAFVLAGLVIVFSLEAFDIVDIPVVEEILNEIGFVRDTDTDDDTDDESHGKNDREDASEREDNPTVDNTQAVTTPPATEDPAEAAYRDAVDYCSALAEQGEYDSAIAYLEELSRDNSDPRYADLLVEYTRMRKDSMLSDAADLSSAGQYRQAIQLLHKAWKEQGGQDYYDAMATYRQEFGLYNTSLYAAGKYNTVLLGADGEVEVCGDNAFRELSAGNWTDMAAVSAGDKHVIGLTKHGTVLAAGDATYGQCDVSGWNDIMAISAGDFHTVALSADGYVYATGYNHKGQCNVTTLMQAAGQHRIVSIAAGYVHTLALLENGTVVACGSNTYGECNVGGWTDIVAIYAGTQFSAGLKMDGSVVVAGHGPSAWDLSGWTDIVNLAAGDFYLVGVKADGTVVSVGVNSSDNPDEGQMNVSGLTNIVFVAAGNDHTVAMNSDGTLFCIGSNKYGQCNYHSRTLDP